jgi:hypothetical protein
MDEQAWKVRRSIDVHSTYWQKLYEGLMNLCFALRSLLAVTVQLYAKAVWTVLDDCTQVHLRWRSVMSIIHV